MKKHTYSCLPVSFYKDFFSGKMDIVDWSVRGAALGLDAVDINALFFQNLSLNDLRALHTQLALPILMVSCYSDFTNPSGDLRRRAVEEMRVCMEKTAALGGSWVRLTAGQWYPNQEEGETLRAVGECFRECCAAAADCGVGVLLENHSKPGAWRYPDFNFNLKRFLCLWETLQALPVSINFDIANAYALTDWRQLLAAVSGRIATVHINDLKSREPLVFCVAGEGIVPAAEMVSAIRASGFEGPLCLEEAGFDGWEGMRRAIAFTKSL
jgi:sugar phosphate isomerase/epimerase